MRSIATPNDHIDMKNSTKATAFATRPICCHIATRSTVHPPSSEWRLRRAQPAGARRGADCGFLIPCSLQREVHRDRHDELHVAVNRERSEEHTSELQSRVDLVCRLLLEKKKI